MVALSSGDNGGRCASASLLMSHTLDPVCHLESRLVTEPWREHWEQEPLSLSSQFRPIHITLLGCLGRHSNSSFKAGITESIFERHKLDE